MKSSVRVLRQAAAALGILTTATLIVPAPAAAQAARPDPLTFLRTAADGAQIGVTIRDVSEADATAAKLTAPAGAFVQDVRADSPAARAGVRAGDVIVTFDGERVRSAAHFARLVDETPEGRSVPAVVQRAGERVTLNVAPEAARVTHMLSFGRASGAARNDDLVTRVAPLRTHLPFLDVLGSPARLGVTVQELTGQLGEYFGATSGVLVTAVTDNSPARTAGVRAGDVITRVNGQTIAHGVDLRRRLGEAAGDVTLTIVRDRKEQTLTVAPAAEPAAPSPAIVR